LTISGDEKMSDETKKMKKLHCAICGYEIRNGSTYIIDEKGRPVHTVGDCVAKRG